MSSHEVHYRPARAEDVAEATRLFVVAVDDLLRRNGQPPLPFTLEDRLPWYQHVFETGIFDVAEQDGRIVALANGIVRGDQWFLSGFWAHPDLQRQGIGRPLLERVRAEGERRGAKLYFTWASIDPAAIGAYLKLGMMPQCQILSFAGAPDAAAVGQALERAENAGYTLEPLEDSLADRLDLEVRGVVRREDHRFLAEKKRAPGFQVAYGGGVAGYFRVFEGMVAPAVWSDPRHGETVTELALSEALKQRKEIRIGFPGQNHAAIRASLRLGLRISGGAHLLTSAPLGKMDRYVPAAGIIF